jgi:hypothetical protein
MVAWTLPKTLTVGIRTPPLNYRPNSVGRTFPADEEPVAPEFPHLYRQNGPKRSPKTLTFHAISADFRKD